MFFFVSILLQCATMAQSFAKRTRGSQVVLKDLRNLDEEKRLVAWIHFPKAGTSFGTTLAHYMNESLPADAGIERAPKLPKFPSVDMKFMMKYPESTWFKGLLWMKYDGTNFNWGGHNKVPPVVVDQFGGHFFGLFRDPSARMYSSWKHFAPFQEPLGYMKRINGVVTKMLAGQSDGLNCTWPEELGGPPCDDVVPDVNLALSRLSEFKFVGLTEEYDFSVCLFHVMFGGDCLPVEFVDTQPAEVFDRGSINVNRDVFNKVEDLDDTVVHAAAASIFWEHMNRYNVTRSRCEKVCANVPEAFALSTTSLLQYRGDITKFDYDWPGRLKYVE